MIESLKTFGFSGVVGLLFGIGMVWWVEPATSGGTGLLILICVAVSVVIGGFASYFLDSHKKAD